MRAGFIATIAPFLLRPSGAAERALFLRQVRRRRNDSDLPALLRSSTLLGFVWKRYTVKAVLRLALLLASQFCAIALGATLGLWTFMDGNNARSFALEHAAALSSALLVGQMVLAALLLTSELGLRRAFIVDCAVLLSSTRPQEADAAAFDRACGRDVLALADSLSSTINIVATVISVVASAALFLTLWPGALLVSAIAFSAVLAASLLLARWGSDLAGKSVEIGRSRLSASSPWIAFGRHLLNWRLDQPSLSRLRILAKLEVAVMNRESLVRAAESFLSYFALCVPLVALGLAAWIAARPADNSLTLAWALVPVLGALLGYPLALSECRRGDSHFASFKTGVSSDPDALDETLTEFGDVWRPFAGSLHRNVDPTNLNPPLARQILEKLRLNDELNSNQVPYTVSAGGENLSAGQLSRLMLARAMHYAVTTRQTLKVTASLASLDTDALARAVQAAAALDIQVEWSDSVVSRQGNGTESPVIGEPTAPEPSSCDKQASRTAGNNGTNGSPKKHRFGRSITRVLLFIPAALGSASVAWVAAQNSDSATMLAASIFLLGAAGIASGVFASYLIERSSRVQALSDHEGLMKAVEQLPSSDLLQRVSRDYPTVIGRITWYRADIAWISALALVSAVAVISKALLLGAALIAIWGVLCTLLWRRTAPNVIRSRQLSVAGVNEFLDRIGNLKVLQGMREEAARTLRRNFSTQGFAVFWQSQSQALTAKAGLALCMSYFSSIVLCGVFAYSHVVGLNGTMVIVVAALLAVSSSSSQLTLALVGYAAQKLSLDRVRCDVLKASRSSLSIHDKAFEIDAFTDKLSGIKFRPTSWSRSELYEIRGSSGSGKSRFLESLCAESKPDGECNFEVLYFPRSSASILKKVSGPGWWTQLLQVTSRSTLQRPTVVLADEVLSEVPVEEAIRRLRDLHELVVSSNGLLIYVDHRFSMGKQVLVEEIAEGGLL